MNSVINEGLDEQNLKQDQSTDASFSRRDFLISGGLMVSLLCSLPAWASGDTPLIITEQANGLIIGDPSKCVGCLRCELACSEFNDGKASPSISRIKVSRNINLGPNGGTWVHGLITQDICKQCPHPVPCANACPNDAIVMADSTNVRVVDPKKCIGCKMCLRACPWDMMSFDPETEKATKCFLCGGNPKCVAACPAEALTYVSWRDLSRTTPPRMAITAVVSPAKALSCNDCHKK